MKKTLCAVLAASSLLFAESYQVNTLSAKQMGMGHTGAALKLGSESMNFNPGGLGFLDKTLDISAGATFIMPEVQFNGAKGKTVNDKLGTPMYVYAATSITDWLSAGLSFTTPYGNSIDYGKNWEGAGLVQDMSLSVFALQPTVAFRPISQLSIGVGPAIYFGSFEQSKLLIPAGGLNGLKALAAHPQLGALAAGIPSIVDKYADTPVSATFSGDADVAIAVNVGAMYDIIQDKLAVGVAYRSGADMKVAKGTVKGTEDITTLNGIIENINTTAGSTVVSPLPVPKLEEGNFKAELPLPANLNAGVSFRPIEKLLLAFDFQVIFWSAYEELVMDFDKTVFGVHPQAGPIKSLVMKKDYNNAFAYRFGAQYTLIDQLDLRLGMYYDETPVDDKNLTPDSPSTNKLGSTIGLSFRPIPNLSIDASFLYSNGGGPLGRDAKSGDKKNNLGQADGLDGRYDVQAWVPSVGLSFNF